MVAVSQLQSQNVQVINYTVSIVTWDAIYALQKAGLEGLSRHGTIRQDKREGNAPHRAVENETQRSGENKP